MKIQWIIKYFLIMCLIIAASGAAASAEDVTIKGRIHILSINSDDTITGIYIETEDERFIVIDNAIGRKLFKMIGTDVIVSGIVTMDGEKNKVIDVKHFKNADDFKIEKFMDEKS